MRFHLDGSLPLNNKTIFVFGSNLAGIHAAGAAKIAFEKYGAKWGKGTGLQNRSYAIPTIDSNIMDTLPLKKVKTYVNQFIKFAKNNPALDFFVTRVGCGLAGYRNEEIAPFFEDVPNNCSLAEIWQEFLR